MRDKTTSEVIIEVSIWLTVLVLFIYFYRQVPAP
jgi:hypothetical protein